MTEQTKKNLGLKALIVTALTAALLIPTLLINQLVTERQARQTEAFKEISSKWAGAQTITGPVISIPYIEYNKDTLNEEPTYRRYIHILPDQLTIEGNINSEKKHRGIFEIAVYASKLTFSGSFSNLSAKNLSVPARNILYNEAFVSIGISDLRGIKESVQMKLDNETHTFNAGIETSDVLKSGIFSPVNLSRTDSLDKRMNFSFDLNLNGSEFIYFTPIGKETVVNLTSNWSNPKFDGAFLPDSSKVTDTGFMAYWKILLLNRNYPQSWLNSKYTVDNSAFGIDLILPIDNYTKTDRSIKYAILIIGLTFLIFFFLELLNNKAVHPLQYILIGFALCIFYILLLSISEHSNYDIAYLIASVMTIGLITWYARSILGERKLATLVGINLVVLYGFIFTIIQLQDFSLLMGSLGLFVILALVMYFSRKIDWSGMTKS